jgi:hypothetical protein
MDAWQKGESGNPIEQRKRAPKHKVLDIILQDYCPRALELVMEIVEDKGVDAHVRLQGLKFWIDHAKGKARQSMEFKVEESIAPQMMTMEQLNFAASKKTKELVFSLIESGQKEEIDEIEEYIRAKRNGSAINDKDVIEGSSSKVIDVVK